MCTKLESSSIFGEVRRPMSSALDENPSERTTASTARYVKNQWMAIFKNSLSPKPLAAPHNTPNVQSPALEIPAVKRALPSIGGRSSEIIDPDPTNRSISH